MSSNLALVQLCSVILFDKASAMAMQIDPPFVLPAVACRALATPLQHLHFPTENVNI
jgi:hypothetical protein